MNGDLQELLRELAKVRGLDFRGYKSASLERRLRKRLSQLNLGTFSEYLEYFRANPEEINQLLSVVLINVTDFFRDPPAWEALRREAFPALLAQLEPGGVFRAWCAGCASGEEVYSLAILIAEHLGAGLRDIDVKIYATDQDEDALNIARRGEYPVDHVSHVRPEWRHKYFQPFGTTMVRVSRDIRRLAIFGRSNLVSDAPISHVNLLVCRNVLIYFDLNLQREVLQRFHYALEEGGVLFLGKSESQLRGFSVFRPINSKWRIFQRAPAELTLRTSAATENNMERQQEFDSALLLQRYVLETMRPGVIVLNAEDVIKACNDSALSVWGLQGAKLAGLRIQETMLMARCPELREQLELCRQRSTVEPLAFQCKFRLDKEKEERTLSLRVRGVFDDHGERHGTLVYAEDITQSEKLRGTVEELETTAEELHSANEELETTNEELQSTNEELETTNEELHSLNEELETTNDELERRTRELDEVSTRYGKILEQMPTPVVLVSDDGSIVIWNPAAERLFALSSRGVVGLKLSQLPLPSTLRRVLVRRHKNTITSQEKSSVRNQRLKVGAATRNVDMQFMPIDSPSLRGVLIMFDPFRSGKSREHAKAAAASRPRDAAAAAADPPPRRKRARKKTSSRK